MQEAQLKEPRLEGVAVEHVGKLEGGNSESRTEGDVAVVATPLPPPPSATASLPSGADTHSHSPVQKWARTDDPSSPPVLKQGVPQRKRSVPAKRTITQDPDSDFEDLMAPAPVAQPEQPRKRRLLQSQSDDDSSLFD